MIKPEHNAVFVHRMEDVLDLYQEPYNPTHPVICFDEQGVIEELPRCLFHGPTAELAVRIWLVIERLLQYSESRHDPKGNNIRMSLRLKKWGH